MREGEVPAITPPSSCGGSWCIGRRVWRAHLLSASGSLGSTLRGCGTGGRLLRGGGGAGRRQCARTAGKGAVAMAAVLQNGRQASAHQSDASAFSNVSWLAVQAGCPAPSAACPSPQSSALSVLGMAFHWSSLPSTSSTSFRTSGAERTTWWGGGEKGWGEDGAIYRVTVQPVAMAGMQAQCVELHMLACWAALDPPFLA